MLAPARGTRIADRYRLERKLGEGGMGSVWAAHDEKLRRDVAVKLVTERIADSETALARFEREAMAVARLRSPYIAQVYDYGVESSSPYIIMELLEGDDLKTRLGNRARLSLVDTVRIVVQVAKALHAAHSAGIVHRDLKPANVFLASDHGEEVCKVFDFGVAKALNDLADDSDTTAEGVLLGTPRYMSPEQAHGAKRVDHRSDLWSLAVIAYACLCGRLPFEAEGTGHVLVKICTEEPPKPSDLNELLPKSIDAFMARALAKEPADRFQSAREMGLVFADIAEVSLSAVGGTPSQPSWEGVSSPGLDAYPSADSLASMRRIDAASDVSRGETSRGGDASHGDGTLGAATTSARPSWLGTRSARVGAGAIALVAVGIAVGVAVTRKPDATPSSAAPSTPVTVAASPAMSASATDPSPAPETTASDPIPSASASAKTTHAVGGPRPSAAASATLSETPPPAPAPAPTPKPSGDGLDLFDKRF